MQTKAGKPQKTRRPVAVPAKPRVAKDPKAIAKAIAKEKKKVENNPQLKALVAQMRGQLKPYFAAELSFANTVCQPDAKQLKKMKRLATPRPGASPAIDSDSTGRTDGLGRRFRQKPEQAEGHS